MQLDRSGGEQLGEHGGGHGIGQRISQLHHAISERVTSVLGHHALEAWEYDVLRALLDSAPRPMTPGQLIGVIDLTSGAMTNRITRLEERGFLTRERDPYDGRQVLVSLSVAGEQIARRAADDYDAAHSVIATGLTKTQRDQLVPLLRVLHLAALDPPPDRFAP